MGLVPDLPTWKFALLVIAYFLSIPPRYAWYRGSQEYKLACKKIRNSKDRLPLSPTMETARAAREEVNRQDPFMRLPGELRNRIYEMTMLTGVVIAPQGMEFYGRSERTIYDLEQIMLHGLPVLHAKDADVEYQRLPYHLGHCDERYLARASKLAIMSQVSRVWREEALRCFYGHNIFKLCICEHFWTRGQGWGAGQRSRYWTTWLKQCPREALMVTTLIWHDLRECPHESANGWRTSRMQSSGDCVVRLDLKRGEISAARNLVPSKENGVSCELCWNSFAKALERLDEDTTVRELLVDLQDEAQAGSTVVIKLIDELDKRLTVEDSGRGVRPDKRSVWWHLDRLFPIM